MRLSAKAIFCVSIGIFVFGACAQDPNPAKSFQAVERPTVVDNSPATDSSNTLNEDFNSLVNDYENQNRVIWQKPEMIIKLLGDLNGKTIADIGAGTGYFAFRILPKAGKVIAVDIDQRFVNFMDSTRQEMPVNLQNRFEARLGKPNDPLLKPSEVDAVLIANTYMYIQNRVSYMQTLRKGMARGAKLLIIDFKDKHTPVGPPAEIRVPLGTVEQELQHAGFHNVVSDDTALDYQYIVTAQN